MDKKEVIAYFDRQAEVWDAEMIQNDRVIEKILDHAGVIAGMDILDVACGTGVLIPDYLRRNVNSVTGVDISAEMIRRAQEKFTEPNVRLICTDVEELKDIGPFDCCMVYNAFPHFPDPERLIRMLAGLVKEGGRLSVAHGMSREQIDRCHAGNADRISNGLMHEEQLAGLMDRYFDVDVVISNEDMYQVCGRKLK